MTFDHDPHHHDDSLARDGPEPGGRDAIGPQGAALVLELRRIQQGFDREFRTRPDNRARKRRPKPAERVAPEERPRAPDPVPPPEVVQERVAAAVATFESGRFPTQSVVRAIDVCLQQVRTGCRFLLDHASGTPVEATGAELTARLDRSFRSELRIGLRVLLIGGAIVGGWATLVPLSGAVVVPGALVAESNVKKIQHPTGGIVAQIRVRDGMHVQEGDLLMRLDETQARTSQQVLARQLDQARVRIARLVAERDNLEELQFQKGVATRSLDSDTAQLQAAETSLFRARASSRRSQKELLRSHIAQLGEEIAGMQAQIKSKAAQLDLIAGELKGVQSLYEKQLVALPRLTALQREAARLDGERGQLVSSIAEAQGKISEAELQIVRIDQDFRAEVMKDLRESQDKEAELAERGIAAKDQLDRIDIRAPTSGIVHQLAAHTIGGVVATGEVIMEIVPDTDELLIEARLQPNDIDHVHTGQKALVRFSAFNQRTTPQLGGVVSYVSADSTHDKQTNAAYYTVRVTLPGSERHRLGDQQLVSGMPAEVFLQTGSRTMMSYLLKPITDQMQRTFSEP
jgi:HlyD family secretion protein